MSNSSVSDVFTVNLDIYIYKCSKKKMSMCRSASEYIIFTYMVMNMYGSTYIALSALQYTCISESMVLPGSRRTGHIIVFGKPGSLAQQN